MTSGILIIGLCGLAIPLCLYVRVWLLERLHRRHIRRAYLTEEDKPEPMLRATREDVSPAAFTGPDRYIYMVDGKECIAMRGTPMYKTINDSIGRRNNA